MKQQLISTISNLSLSAAAYNAILDDFDVKAGALGKDLPSSEER